MLHPLLFSAGFRGNAHNKLVQKRGSHESLRPRLEEDAFGYVERGSNSLTKHSLAEYTSDVQNGSEHQATRKAKRYASQWRKILELIDLD